MPISLELTAATLIALEDLMGDALQDDADDVDLVELAEVGDTILSFKGDVGAIVEAVDDAILRAVLNWFACAVSSFNDPERIRLRGRRAEARGHRTIAARRYARADKVEARKAAKGKS